MSADKDRAGAQGASRAPVASSEIGTDALLPSQPGNAATTPEQAIRRALDHLKVYCAGGEECRIHDEAEAALEALLTNRSKGC